MKTNNQIFPMIFIVILNFLMLSTGFNHIPAAYSQNQSSAFQAEAKALDDMPAQKVKVGDTAIAYKQLGKGNAKPIVLVTGLGATMDMWSPLLLEQLTSSNYSVTIFDNRGAGESTAGTKEFSTSRFANDTAGLLDSLNITKADVLGFSMGSFIAQELTLSNPEKVNKLIFHTSLCGGNESKPANPKVDQAFSNPLV